MGNPHRRTLSSRPVSVINWYLCNVNVFSYAVLDPFYCGSFLSSFRFLLSSSPTSQTTLLATDNFEVLKINEMLVKTIHWEPGEQILLKLQLRSMTMME
jgi:hypothetical protein